MRGLGWVPLPAWRVSKHGCTEKQVSLSENTATGRLGSLLLGVLEFATRTIWFAFIKYMNNKNF